MTDEPPEYDDEPNEYDAHEVPPELREMMKSILGAPFAPGSFVGSRTYRLEGGKPVLAENIGEFIKAMHADRLVDKTRINRWVEVTTVFLALDHRHGGDKPVLWETAIHRTYGGYQIANRYTSLADAKKGHWDVVDWCRKLPWWTEWYRTQVAKAIVNGGGVIVNALVWAACCPIGRWRIKHLWLLWICVLLQVFWIWFSAVVYGELRWMNVGTGIFCLYVIATIMFDFRLFWFWRRRKKRLDADSAK